MKRKIEKKRRYYKDREGYEKTVKNLVDRPEDRYIPKSCVDKLMKQALVENRGSTTSAESKELVKKCVTEFIGFITQEALERVENHKRKVMNGEDILWAMGNLGFEVYSEHMRLQLQKYRENDKERKEARRKKQSERKYGNRMVDEDEKEGDELNEEVVMTNDPKDKGKS